MRSVKAWILAGCAICAVGLPAAWGASRMAELNQKSFTVLAGESTWLSAVDGLVDTLNHENGLHVLAVKGNGCLQASADLMNLQQIDMAVLTADCVAYAEAQGLIPNATQKLAYVSRLKALPIVLLTRRTIPNLTALAGLRIATGPAQSAGFATGELLLGGLDLPFTRVAKSGVAAVSALQSGEADAALLVGLDALDGTLDPSKFHALGLNAPAQTKTVYAPALLTATDLKGLLTDQSSLETVSTALALAVVNWKAGSPQAEKVKFFSDQYFAATANLGDAGDSVAIPNWQRHQTSSQALEALDTQQQDNQSQGDGP
jgi:hypothetical protein